MIRQHETYVLAEGTFRVVLTRSGRIFAAIDLEESALGPLHLAFEIGVPLTFQTGSLIGRIAHGVEHAGRDIGHGFEQAGRDLGHVAEGTFDATAKVSTTLARPAFNIVRDAAAGGAHLLGQVPLVPERERKRIEAASRVMMRARLGDVDAKRFIRAVAHAAKSGVEVARHAGDALLTGERMVAHVLDTPLRLAEKVPLIGGTLHALSPFQKLERMTSAIQNGDFRELKKIVTDDVRLVEGVTSLVPGIGSGIGAAIGTGLAVLDGGGPLDIAIHAAYGAIPIPPGVREVTDMVLETVLKLAHHGSVTDAALAAARSNIPEGLPRHVFDTLVHLVIKRVPVKRAAAELVGHYVERYAPGAGLSKGVAETVDHVVRAEREGARATRALVGRGTLHLPGADVKATAALTAEGQ